jgi:hypothetical protein
VSDIRNELAPTSECISIERLGQALTDRERNHLAGCARCQSELALWKEFEANEMRAEDEADVQAIVDELRRPNNAARANNVVPFRPRILAVAAMLVIAVAVAFLVENREPSVNMPIGGESAYRSAAVEVVAPKGDVATPPSELRWNTVAGAKEYDVAVFEVDRTNLWHATAADTHVALPSSVVAQCVPGKTLLWQVTARRDATVIAQSGIQRFRVRTP